MIHAAISTSNWRILSCTVTSLSLCTPSAAFKVHSLPWGRLPSSRCIRSAPPEEHATAHWCLSRRSRYSTKTCRLLQAAYKDASASKQRVAAAAPDSRGAIHGESKGTGQPEGKEASPCAASDNSRTRQRQFICLIRRQIVILARHSSPSRIPALVQLCSRCI